MTLEIQGKLIKLLAPVTGEGKNGAWTKQEFILETYDQYPKKVCCSVWGDKVETLRRFNLGDDIKASINIESREYNERWFTEVRAWKLDPGNQQGAAPQQGGYNSAPQYNQPPQQQYGNQGQSQYNGSAPSPAPSFPPADNNAKFFESGKEDDLPF